MIDDGLNERVEYYIGQYQRAMWKILMKANDERGKGHDGRVGNFVGHDLLKDIATVIVGYDCRSLIPEGVDVRETRDSGFRVDLDSESIYKKFNSKHDVGIGEYYLLKNIEDLLKDKKMFYLDDQNGMSAILMDELSEFLTGKRMKPLREMMPDGSKIVSVLETQLIYNRMEIIKDNYLDDSTKTTERKIITEPAKIRAMKDSDYLHLASDLDFLKIAAPMFSLPDGLEDKIVSSGFPLSTSIKNTLDQNNLNRNHLRDEIMGEANKFDSYVYCTFGGANGIESVLNPIYEHARHDKNTLYGITDPNKKFKEIAEKLYGIKDLGNSNYSINRADNIIIYCEPISGKQRDDHFKRLVAADAVIQGAGSGTIYESAYAKTPAVIVPLERPGFEQLIKAMGMYKFGCGDILLPNDMYNAAVFEQMKNSGIDMKEFTGNNLGNSIENMLNNRVLYRNNHGALSNYFKDEDKIARSIALMMCGFSPEDINKYLK